MGHLGILNLYSPTSDAASRLMKENGKEIRRKRRKLKLVRPRTDIWFGIADNQRMRTSKEYVTAVDRLCGDVVISFQDNRTAVFPASLLYASLPQAQELFESEMEFDDKAQTFD